MNTVRSVWNMACPECRADHALIVEMVTLALVTPDGTEPDGDPYWDEYSWCTCTDCGWYGEVSDTYDPIIIKEEIT